MSKTGEWLHWHWDTTTCGRVTGRRPAAWRCLPFKSPTADNRCPHKIRPHHRHYMENEISCRPVSLSRLFLFFSSVFVCSFLSLSSFFVYFLYVISYLFIHKLRNHFPCWYQIIFMIFIFPMFSSLVSPCRRPRQEGSNKKRFRPI